MVIDSHMHLNSFFYNNLNEEIVKINKNKQIESVINVGLNIPISHEVVKISKSNRKFYSAVGIHPLKINNQKCDDLYLFKDSISVVAIGEIGLDRNKDNLEVQKLYLIKQIIIANDLKLPVIIHSNKTSNEIIKIFENYVKPKYGCVFHSFYPNKEILDYLVKNNYYVSFSGKITYKMTKKSLDIISSVPNDLFLIETNSPYMLPYPRRCEDNSVKNISYVLKRLSEIKKMDCEDLEEITLKNTKRLFKKII